MSTATTEQLAFLSWFEAQVEIGNRLPTPKTLKAAMGRLSMNFRDEHGHSPMGAIIDRCSKDYTDQTITLFQMILERGGNPLNHGNPLRRAMTHAACGQSMAARVIQAEENSPSTPLRGEDGGNVLHDWMEINPKGATWHLSDETSKPSTLLVEFANQARLVDGYTPAHCLWAGVMKRVLPGTKRNEDPYEDEPTQALVASQVLLDLGVGFTIPDSCGQTAEQMAMTFFRQHSVPKYHRKTFNQLQRMAVTTPKPTQPLAATKPGLRL